MEATPQSQLVMEANVGRHASPYLSRELSMANESVKQPLRDRVLAHILKHHAPGRLRCLSLPGERWAFETSLMQRWDWGPCSFVGAERDAVVMRRGLPWMPRALVRNPEWDRFPLEEGYVDFASTDKAVVINCDLQDVIRFVPTDHVKHTAWKKHFCRWTCAWFDFTTMLHPRLEGTLGRISQHMAGVAVVPIALTLMSGRESREQTRRITAIADDRVDYVCRVLRGNRFRTFELDEAVEYTSVAGCPMMLLLGRMPYKPPYTPAPEEEIGTAYRVLTRENPEDFQGGDYFSYGGVRKPAPAPAGVVPRRGPESRRFRCVKREPMPRPRDCTQYKTCER
jgi:hypothetical protein